MVKPLDNR